MNSKDEIKKIDTFNNFNIINDRFLVVKENLSINDVYFELCNKKICEYIIDDNSIDQLYKKICDRMDDVFKYYYDMQEKIEDMLYPDESFYYLILNISNIYHLLDLGRFFLDKWKETCYGVIRKIYRIRDNKVIDLKSLKWEYFIFYFVDLYKRNFDLSFFKKVNIFDFEKYHFLSYISVCDIIDGRSLSDVFKLNEYVNRTYNLLLKEYKKYQENSHDEFKEKNEDI